MKRTAVLIFSCLSIAFAAYATCPVQEEVQTCFEKSTAPVGTAMIQLRQELLNLTPGSSVFERTVPPSDAVPDVPVSIGAAKVLCGIAPDARHGNIPEIVEEIKKAEEHLGKVREAYESIKKDYDKGLKTEKELQLAENDIEDAKMSLERLEEEFRVCSGNNLRISVRLKNGLLKLLDLP